MESNDFAMECRLRDLDPALHRRYTDVVFGMQHYLARYRLMFPEYSDHSMLHSLTVMDMCNRLAGSQAGNLNADELYVLLAACCLHDSGMGITMDLYREFSRQIDFGSYFDSHPADDYPAIIRDYHHEFSGLFIRKFADLLEIPSEAHLQAVVQAVRGHRKTDLEDPGEYPAALPVPGGNTVCLPYLAALIRLADEIDVCASRNPLLLFDLDSLVNERQIVINRMIRAVRELRISATAFTLYADAAQQDLAGPLRLMAEKMQQTLDYCRKTVRDRTPYVITQQHVRMKMVVFPEHDSKAGGL